MNDNSITTHAPDGSLIEVYENVVMAAFDEYKNSLDDAELIYKTSGFNGAIKHVYMTVFKPDKPMLYNAGTKLDTGNIELLNQLWDTYTMLCHKYGHRPTVIRFSIMVGISMETFDSWAKGKWRNNTSLHSESIKRWRAEAENALVDGASESNSIGAIFLLKSNFGYRETSPAPAEEAMLPVHETAAEISARYANAALPEKPDFDDMD